MNRSTSISLDELEGMKRRTRITAHICEHGMNAADLPRGNGGINADSGFPWYAGT